MEMEDKTQKSIHLKCNWVMIPGKRIEDFIENFKNTNDLSSLF